MNVSNAALMGILSEGGGLSVGIIVLYLFKVRDGRNMGMLYGATSGLMLAMICFDVLPTALEKGSMPIVFCGIIIGTLLGVLLDDIVDRMEQHFISFGFRGVGRAGLILAIGIAIHNVPEGFALGALAHTAVESIWRFTLILALHSIPEGIAMAIPFKNSGTPMGVLLTLALALGCMMGLGSMLGFTLSGLNENFVCTGLGIAGGIILYIVCGELIPESRKIWNGRWTTIATILGVMGGILLLKY